VSGQIHAPIALAPGKDSPLHPLDRRLGGPKSRGGGCGEEKNLAQHTTVFHVIFRINSSYIIKRH
jgi:hypothetical protein